jgi:hypothetical protein
MEGTKKCYKCGEVLPRLNFYKDISRRDGHDNKCKSCTSEKYGKWYKQNRNRKREQCKAWEKNNPERVKLKKERREAAIARATPKWLTQKQKTEIAEFYINCKPGQTVDHIIAIQAKEVCGLHVPWNLQWLTKEENGRKSNKFTPYIEIFNSQEVDCESNYN